MPEDLLTPHAAADLLKVPVSFIYERTRRDAIPLRRIGKYVRIPRDELMRWVDAQSHGLHTSHVNGIVTKIESTAR